MATISIFKKLELNEKETERFNILMLEESPCKDIQPISLEEKQKNEAEIRKWLLKSIR